MAFELLKKAYGSKQGIEEDEVAINNYGITFGESVGKKFDSFSYCEIYLDKENKRVGLKPSNNLILGFKVKEHKKIENRKYISGTWAKRLYNNKYRVAFEDDMIVINYCEIYDKKTK